MRDAGSISRGAAAVACGLALGLFSFASVASGACANEDLRVQQGATGLPGCLALELANPPAKFSQPAYLPVFSRDGERMAIKIEAALAETPGYQHFGGDAYVATRGLGGWLSAPTAPLDTAIVAGGARNGNPSTFTPDLSGWTQIGATQAQFQVGVARLFGGGLDGSFRPLSPLLVPIVNSPNGELEAIVARLEVDGSSEDLRVNVFRGAQARFGYLPGDPLAPAVSEPGGDRNSYVMSLDANDEPVLELLARDKDEKVWGGRCGAHLGGEDVTFNQGAVAPDGELIFLTTRPAQPWNPGAEVEPPCALSNPLRVLRRVSTPAGTVIEEITPGGPAAAGDDLFQAASADSSKVYLTSPRDLAASDADASAEPCSATLGSSKGCDLYLYDANRPEGDRMVQVSAGGAGDPDPGEGADVLSSVTAVSGDGSHAYFVAQGVLTSDSNPEGATATAGQPNLYLYDAGSGETSFIGTLAGSDQGSLQGGLWGTVGSFFGDASAMPLYGPGPQGGGDGHVLVFASKAPLTADDEDVGFRDVFRYDAAAGTLERISKAAPGGADNGPFDVNVNPAVAKVTEYNFGEATRWVSEDAETIAFSTAEPLVPGDEDGATNPYVWMAGQLGASVAVPAQIPGTEDTAPPAVSPVGASVAFSTSMALLPRDVDTAPDVYVAREGGGFPEPPPPPPCDPLIEGIGAGGCRDALPAPIAAAASTGAITAGNVKEPRHCKKGQVRRKGRCVRKKSKGRAAKRANRRTGGSK